MWITFKGQRWGQYRIQVVSIAKNCLCVNICVHESYLVDNLLEFCWFLISSYADLMQINLLVCNYKI